MITFWEWLNETVVSDQDCHTLIRYLIKNKNHAAANTIASIMNQHGCETALRFAKQHFPQAFAIAFNQTQSQTPTQPVDLSQFVQSRDAKTKADLDHMQQEYSFLHRQIGVPLKYRIYWTKPEILQAMGYKNPGFVTKGNYEGDTLKFLPSNNELRNVPRGYLDIGYLIQPSGWMAIAGRDNLGRRAWIAHIPPQEVPTIKQKLDNTLGL